VSKLRLLDLALLVFLGLLGWQLRREWIASHTRDQALLRRSLPAAHVPGLAPLDKVDPTTAAAYSDVATKDLFSEDRNPNVVVEPPKPEPEKPPPPFPVAHGVMLWPGVPPTIVLSEKSNGPQKGYHPGESIGQWKLVSLDNSFVGFEWNGKEFKKRIDELIDRTPVPEVSQAAVGPVRRAAAPTTALGAQSLSSSPKSGPGLDVGGGQRACVAGDDAPAGTVVDGLRKVVTATPFGNNCHWEAAK
jgi:hypothetical protein